MYLTTSRYSVAPALLISLSVFAEASAQTPSVSNDFTALGQGRMIVVVDDSGKEKRGRLLRFTPDSLTMTVDGHDLAVEREHVRTVYERGDSLKNGALIGLAAGAAAGVVSGVSASDCGGFFEVQRSCTGGEKAQIAAVAGSVFGAIGLGIGAGIDALIKGRRVLYERPHTAAAPTIGVLPALSASSRTLLLSIGW